MRLGKAMTSRRGSLDIVQIGSELDILNLWPVAWMHQRNGFIFAGQSFFYYCLPCIFTLIKMKDCVTS